MLAQTLTAAQQKMCDHACLRQHIREDIKLHYSIVTETWDLNIQQFCCTQKLWWRQIAQKWQFLYNVNLSDCSSS